MLLNQITWGNYMSKTNKNLHTLTQPKTKQKSLGEKKFFFWLKEDNEIRLKQRGPVFSF